MSTPLLSTPPSSARNSVSPSESLVESSADEKNDSDEQSTSAPVMKSKTKKSSLREAFSSSNPSTSVTTPKDPRAEFNKKIEEARQSFVENNESWKKFIEKNIRDDGFLNISEKNSKKLHELLNCLNISPNPKITRLHCWGFTINAATATALTKAIKSNSTINKLDVIYGRFDAAGLKIFIDAIMSNLNRNITSLDLHVSNIDNEFAKIIANAIKANPNSRITTINLTENHFGNEGAQALSEAIGTHQCSITELQLSYVAIDGKYRGEIEDYCELNAKRSLLDSHTTSEKANSTHDSNKVGSKDHFLIKTKEKSSKEKNNKKS